MKQISLKKIEIVEIQVLQSELLNFLTYKNYDLQMIDKSSNDFYDAVLIIDILQKLYYNFRSKIEKTTKTTANLNLSCSEAVILVLCCNFNKTIRANYDAFVMQKTLGLIHKQLIDL
jgi:hypothetical protein